MRLLEIDSQLNPGNYKKFDNILLELCDLIKEGQKKDNSFYGMVGAAILDPQGNKILKTSQQPKKGKWHHAERNAIDAYIEEYGKIPKGTIIITTLSPCTDSMKDRYGRSCTKLLNNTNIREVYCGYIDPTQSGDDHHFKIKQTKNSKIQKLCKKFSDTFLKI